MKKVIIFLAAAAVLIAGLICFEHWHNTTNEVYENSYSIPVSEKIYPLVNENYDMTVYDTAHELTYDDVCTLTKYVDLWATINDTRGDGFKEDEITFASADRLAQVKAVAENDTVDYAVDGTQVLSMSMTDEGKVEIVYIVKLSGQNEAAGIPEGEYEAVHGLLFEKINGTWHLDGVSYVLMAPAGTVDYVRNPITGKYTITPTGDYYS